MRALVVVIALTLAALAHAQVPHVRANWQCPQPQVQQNFDVARYMGLWYEIDRYWYSFPEFDSYCATAKYGLKNNSHVSVDNSARVGSVSGMKEDFIGDAYAPDPKVPAKLSVVFDVNPVPAPLWILETDYSSYSILYSCTEVLDALPVEFAWIQSRNATIGDTPFHDKIIARAAALGVNVSPFIKTPQKGCW